MISIEFFNPEKHYEAATQWWVQQNWNVIPLSHLPKTGIIVCLDGKPVAATWIYKTDSAFCWIEWIVASPEVRHEVRDSVLSVLISSARMIAKSLGFETIHMSIKNQSLAKRIEAQGFVVTDQEMTNYVCDLQGGK